MPTHAAKRFLPYSPEQLFDLVGPQIEQPASLDDFQGLVHHRGRIDGDLGAHVPSGMGQGLGDGHLGKVHRRVPQERPAAGRRLWQG